jgi:ABC-type dipeptide/oligopeptide/nickel transport system permease component
MRRFLLATLLALPACGGANPQTSTRLEYFLTADPPTLDPALGMRSVAFLSRMTCAAMQEVLQSDFVRTARAKGLLEGRVVLSHAFRNALLPVVTVLGLDFGSYLTGSILTETIFSWPGVGRYVLTAIDKRDLPAIQGSVLFSEPGLRDRQPGDGYSVCPSGSESGL